MSRTRRNFLLVAVLAAVVGVLVGGMYAYDHSRRNLITAGVRVNGVPVGGLDVAAAQAKILHTLVTPLDRSVTVRAGSRSWVITGDQADVRVDSAGAAARALDASRSGSILTRTMRGLTGGHVNKNIPLAVSYSHAAVRRFDAQIRAVVNAPAQSASVSASASGLHEVASHGGLTVDSAKLGADVEYALTDASYPAQITVPTDAVAPVVSSQQLAGQYPAFIIVNRSSFKLRLYQHLKLTKTYQIAVGMQGLETPGGLYHIQWKQVDPPWYVPNSAWAGSLAGKTIPPGPQDPLKARFMSFDGAAGIHGIAPSEYSTIGHDASHGCVRMRIPDVIDLYAKTPVGTPVYIA
jgi:lipoprotein-anchoring transpeptidase ErfK/SrfK